MNDCTCVYCGKAGTPSEAATVKDFRTGKCLFSALKTEERTMECKVCGRSGEVMRYLSLRKRPL